MKSKASFFNFKRPYISGALIKENIRNFWPICLLLTLIYFLPIFFMFLVNSKDPETAFYFAEVSLANSNPIFIGALVIFPILTAAAVFKYLYKSSSVTVIHSMPFTRTGLFLSNYLTGLIILIAPLLINALAMFATVSSISNSYEALKLKEYMAYSEYTYSFEPFGLTHCMNWLLVSILITIFIYTIAVLAATLSGNLVMHVINSLLLNFAPVLIYLIVLSYMSIAIFGLSGSIMNDQLPWFSPLFDLDGILPYYRVIFFVIITIVAFLCANILYEKRKMETAGDSVSFRFTEPIISIIIAFIGMAFISLFSYLMNEKLDLVFYATVAATSVVALIIANMVVQKTPKILNKKTVISSIIYLVIVCALIVTIHFDIFAVSKKVPEVTDVKSISVNMTGSSTILGNQEYGYTFEDGSSESIVFESQEAIEALTALHEEIVNNQAKYSDDMTGVQDEELSEIYYAYDDFKASLYLSLDYKLGNGKLQRAYVLSQDTLGDNKNLLKLLSSEEFKKKTSLKAMGYSNIKSIAFSCYFLDSISGEAMRPDHDEDEGYDFSVSGYWVDIPNNKKESLLETLDKDYMAQGREEITGENDVLLTLDIEGEGYESLQYKVPKSYTNTIKWLKENNYYNKVVLGAEDIESVNLEFISGNKVVSSSKVTDRKDIERLFKGKKSNSDISYSKLLESDYLVMEFNYKDESTKAIQKMGTYDEYGSSYIADRASLDLEILMENIMNRAIIIDDQALYKSIASKYKE